MTQKAANLIQSVERALDILENLSQQKDGWQITALAKKLDLKVSTVHNLMKTLVSRNYVEQANETLKYKLGYKSFHLSQSYSAKDKLISLTKKHLEKLNKECNDLVFLGTLKDHSLVCLASAKSNHPLSVNPNQVWTNKLHCTAAGKILLADCSSEELKLIIKKHGLSEFTRSTITERKELLLELEKVRKQGFATASDESLDGISSVGVPLKDISGHVIASLAIGIPTVRMNPDRKKKMLEMLKKTAADILLPPK